MKTQSKNIAFYTGLPLLYFTQGTFWAILPH
jgi:hypothetical protein